MNNPYSWSTVNPAIFFGRESLLDDLLNGLPGTVRCSYGIAGGRRMGKSTLLRKVEAEIRQSIPLWSEDGLQVILVYVDGLALPRPLDQRVLWEALYSQVQASVPNLPVAPVPSSSDLIRLFGNTLCNGDSRIRIIALFDEIEPILACDWADSFLAQWRALLSNTPGISESITAVFAGAREISRLQHDIGSPLMDILEWRSLRCFGKPDVRSLIDTPSEVVWPDEFVDLVFRESGGHPMLIQYIMQTVCSGTTSDPLVH